MKAGPTSICSEVYIILYDDQYRSDAASWTIGRNDCARPPENLGWEKLFMANNNQSILVTGATGQLGRLAVDALSKRIGTGRVVGSHGILQRRLIWRSAALICGRAIIPTRRVLIGQWLAWSG